MLRLLACLSMVGLAGCFTPSDVTPIIYVNPRAAQRLPVWFNKSEPTSEPTKPAAARVHVMRDGQQLGGPNATGRPGDPMLENQEVVFVVGQILPDGGGNVIDAADARVRKDELVGLSTSFGPSRHNYQSLQTGAEADGSAWVEVRGRDTGDIGPVITSRYTLHPPDRALLVETTVKNEGEWPVELYGLGAHIEWGTAEKVAPRHARGFSGPTSGPYVGAVGKLVSYAITSTEGKLEAMSGTSWTETFAFGKRTLAAHESVTYARVFVVGERPDTSSLVGELALAAGQPVGSVKLAVPGAAPGTTIELTPDGSTEPLTMVEPFEGVLPLGRYWITPPGGRPGARPLGALDVRAEGTASATVKAE
jgi:hypothetical protein